MRCHYCTVGEMRPGTTSITLQRHGATVTVHHIPALVCDACGEAYIDAETSQKLFDLADALVNTGLPGLSVEISGKVHDEKAA
ncbi:MAG: type II toxin-antitoxin system MqsA family antitoxin [Armatimonadota bacterium]